MAEQRLFPHELDHRNAMNVVLDLADFDVPVILFSGGEPLLRKDLMKLAKCAHDYGIKPVLSTNGTLLSNRNVLAIKEAGFEYVGVSLDGTRDTHDYFRGLKGAFNATMLGIRNLVGTGVKTGIRFTITSRNQQDLPEVLRIATEEKLARICVYHFVPSGRGRQLASNEIPNPRVRETVNFLIRTAMKFRDEGRSTEILTVDNHADAALLYLRLKEDGNPNAEHVLGKLRRNGGNSSGVGIACIDSRGFVHPDQFWQHYSMDNVRRRTFGEIWTDESEPLLYDLRNRKQLLKGNCMHCRFLDVCNGNMRVRAEAYTGDIWAQDPACYLTNEEILGVT